MMKNILNCSISILRTIIVSLACFATVTSNHAQSCDFTTGPVSLNINGGNQTQEYNTIYVVSLLDGTIMSINDLEPEFEILFPGFFMAQAINFREGTTISGLEVGRNIGAVTGDDCYDVGFPFGFTVCEELNVCNHCLGETIMLDVQGGNNNIGFTTKYVLTDRHGEILEVLDDPIFEDLSSGLFLAFAVNYETDKVIEGLEVGRNITMVKSGCYDVSEPYVIGVCDQLSPSIFFDLKGCDITQTALLQVGETYSGYMWNTGATTSFIEVSATNPATYTVTVTLDNGCIGIVSERITGNEISRIGDFVWEDENLNGRQDAEESGLNGITVNLFADFDNNGVPDFPDFPSCITTTSDHPTTGEPGWYEFTVYGASYVVGFVGPNGFVPTTPNIGDDASDSDINSDGLTGRISIGSNENRDNVDAGFVISTSICGSVFEDADADGRRDLTEEGLDDITLNLYTAEGLIVATTMTATIDDEAGLYCFQDIPVRDYYVEIILPDGRSLTLPNIGNDEALDSDATGANGPGTTDTFNAPSGNPPQDVTFGIYTGGVVCGIVWQENDEGLGTENVYDPGIDSAIANSEVYLLFADTEFLAMTGVTDESGRYCINGIPAGTYKLSFGASGAGVDFVQPSQGGDPLLDSDVDINTSMTPSFFVPAQDTIQGINAGLRLEALPIELTYFDGHWDDVKGKNVLEWQTATEINNDFFEVQRISDTESNFQTIAMVDGSGTVYDIVEYTFEDGDIKKSGTYYYRLKQVDYNGGFEYSNIIAIDVILNRQAALKVYPNPVSANMVVEIMVDKADDVTLTLSDMLGRDMSSVTSHKLLPGKSIIDFNVKDIPPGTYTLSTSIGNITQYQKINIAR